MPISTRVASRLMVSTCCKSPRAGASSRVRASRDWRRAVIVSGVAASLATSCRSSSAALCTANLRPCYLLSQPPIASRGIQGRRFKMIEAARPDQSISDGRASDVSVSRRRFLKGLTAGGTFRGMPDRSVFLRGPHVPSRQPYAISSYC